MSKIVRVSKVCACCNASNDFLELEKSDNTGYMDLDTRPAGSMRRDLSLKIQECPNCHYANSDVSVLIEGMDKDLVKEEEYTVIWLSTTGEERKYLLHAYLMKNVGNYMRESYYYLSAAWACDDAKRTERAIEHRLKAIEVLRPHFNEFETIDNFLIVVDMYRRARLFNDCINLASNLLKGDIKNVFIQKLLRYEIELATSCDDKCHDVGEIQ